MLEQIFQSTRPLRGATAAMILATYPPADFNPRAPCGARRNRQHHRAGDSRISIHAPLAGRDPYDGPTDIMLNTFQSTRPLRGATDTRQPAPCWTKFQSTRPLRGATLCSCCAPPAVPGFQSTRPLRGATTDCKVIAPASNDFNPRAPCGARLCTNNSGCRAIRISIHAPLAGRDHLCSLGHNLIYDFNPRTPCGVRP